MTKYGLEGLSAREGLALQALIDKRAVYRAMGHGMAARTMGLAIWLVWQVLHKVDAGPDTAQAPMPPIPQVRRDDSREFLARAIDKLPHPGRQAMRLHVLMHKSADEIATEMGMSVGDAEHLLGEAAAKLRTILSMSAERRAAAT